MPRETFGVTVTGWKNLGESLKANAADYPNLESHCLKLVATAEKAYDLLVKRDALDAEKRQTTKELRDLLEEGRKLANFLRAGMRQSYGHDSEKLVEFHIRPRRNRRRRPAPKAEPAE
jgi:hypothetical protein